MLSLAQVLIICRRLIIIMSSSSRLGRAQREQAESRTYLANHALTLFSPIKKPQGTFAPWGFGIKCLAMTYSHMASATLPSAQSRFTSEFGMGSGGTNSLWSPDKLVIVLNNQITTRRCTCHGVTIYFSFIEKSLALGTPTFR